MNTPQERAIKRLPAKLRQQMARLTLQGYTFKYDHSSWWIVHDSEGNLTAHGRLRDAVEKAVWHFEKFGI